MAVIHIYRDVLSEKATSPTLKADYERYPQSEKIKFGKIEALTPAFPIFAG